MPTVRSTRFSCQTENYSALQGSMQAVMIRTQMTIQVYTATDDGQLNCSNIDYTVPLK